jgi:HTH-type transcriptional regulator/antitoxin PezA
LNERLKVLRKTLDLTQQDFANRIGVKRNTVATYEMGRSSPSDSAVSLICREFNVNEEWLRTGAGGDENMFVKLSEDEELAMYTQMLLDSTDDVVADMIKETIVIYEKLDNDSKQALKNVARKLLDKMNGK